MSGYYYLMAFMLNLYRTIHSDLLKGFNLALRNLVFILLLILSACSTTRRLQKNEYLLIDHKVDIQNPDKHVSAGSLLNLVQQKPNKKFIGIFPFKLWLNGISKKWGEPPVILDRSLIDESKDQMLKYLNNIGYYNSVVEDSVYIKKKKAKKVFYQIHLSKPYIIRNINYDIADTSIRKLVFNNRNNSFLEQGAIFNSYVLNNERVRISNHLKNNGYFGFIKSFVFYEVDSSLNNREVKLTLLVKNPNAGPGSLPEDNFHKKYYINDVLIHADFKRFNADTIVFDTIVDELKRKNVTEPDYYKFIFSPPLKIKPSVISRSSFLESNKQYNETDVQQTYRKLTDLRIYKYVNLNFKNSLNTAGLDPSRNYLDCTIQLTRNPVHSYSFEAQGTNTGGDLGISGYISYQNKNLFRGGEIFNIRVKGGLEAQGRGTGIEQTPENKLLFFNTFEAGLEASLQIPKFLAPINQDLFSKYFRPKTSINAGYNIQDRIEYDRVITNVSFGYEWNETKYKSHILYPADINVVKVQTTPQFDSILAGESQRFRNQYTDHLILGLRYSYIYNNQEINRIKNFIYFRGNIETSGNLFNFFVTSIGTPENEEGFRQVFGIRYSQFFKSNLDFRYYIVVDKNHSVAFRGFAGIALPYGNSRDIPFEKGYYGGGANGLRAWRLRYLGPGSYPNTNESIERVGDIQFEANVEYRFPVYKIIKGAIFYDFGNIWLLSENNTFPGGKFKFNNFFKELAMDVGVGIRLDFNYFVFRIDLAQKLNDPALPVGRRWVIGQQKGWFDPVFNLGIGYPF